MCTVDGCGIQCPDVKQTKRRWKTNAAGRGNGERKGNEGFCLVFSPAFGFGTRLKAMSSSLAAALLLTTV